MAGCARPPVTALIQECKQLDLNRSLIADRYCGEMDLSHDRIDWATFKPKMKVDLATGKVDVSWAEQ